jgi:hypothetical protein
MQSSYSATMDVRETVSTVPSLLGLPVEIRLSIFALIFEGAIITTILEKLVLCRYSFWDDFFKLPLSNLAIHVDSPKHIPEQVWDRSLIIFGEQHQIILTCRQTYNEGYHAALSSGLWVFNNYLHTSSILRTDNFQNYKPYITSLVLRHSIIESDQPFRELPALKRLVVTGGFLTFHSREEFHSKGGQDLCVLARARLRLLPGNLEEVVGMARSFGISLLCAVHVDPLRGSDPSLKLPVSHLTPFAVKNIKADGVYFSGLFARS